MGLKNFKDSSILITGLVRNAELSIANELFRVKEAFSKFKSVSYLIVESDSSDNTILELKKIARHFNNFELITLGNLSTSIVKRTDRLAHCRNRYLKEIRENIKYSTIDFVSIIDLDGMNNLLNAEAIISCWERNDWDVCAANQSGPYYDVWALRHPIWSPNDCWQQCRFFESCGVPHERAKEATVYLKQVIIPSNSNWIEVDSAFGGLAIYKKSTLMDGQYIGSNEFGEEICDHPSLHETIKKNGGRIFINPKMINTDFTDHTSRFNKKPQFLYL